MDLGLHRRTAIVLGASRGLGRAIAASLAAEGANILLCSRSADTLASVAAELDSLGSGRIAFHAADLATPGAATAIHAAAEEQIGPVDILVNNGGGPPPGPVAGAERATWEEQFQAMVTPFFELGNLVVPGMRDRGWGRILSVVSSGVIQPIPNLGLSNALRASVVGWSKTLANEVAGDGVTVNCLAPGRIATDRTARLDAKTAERQGISVEEVERNSRTLIPAGRYGDPREFGDTAAFLVSERGSYITGSVIRVDGGLIKSI